MPDRGHSAFTHRVAVALIDPKRLPVDDEEILRRVLYETIRRFCEKDRRGHAAVVNAAYSDYALGNGLEEKLRSIAWEEVIPALSADDRANLDRTLRSRRGPQPPRPPAGPPAPPIRKNRRGPGR